MRLVAILASALATLIAFVWLVKSPGYDSGGASAAAVAALFSSFFLKRDSKSEGQTQQVSGSSTAIQAGRDANVRNINNK